MNWGRGMEQAKPKRTCSTCDTTGAVPVRAIVTGRVLYWIKCPSCRLMAATMRTWAEVDRHFDRLLVLKRQRERERLERLWAAGLESTPLAALLMRRLA